MIVRTRLRTSGLRVHRDHKAIGGGDIRVGDPQQRRASSSEGQPDHVGDFPLPDWSSSQASYLYVQYWTQTTVRGKLTMLKRIILGGLVSASACAFAVACAGPSSSPSPPASPPSGTAVITVTAAGASPKTLTVSPGSQVTFVNNDSREHPMYSDPHPEHTDCPELNQVGFLAAGQSRQTGNLIVSRRCGFHDHNLPQTATLQGTIAVQ